MNLIEKIPSLATMTPDDLMLMILELNDRLYQMNGGENQESLSDLAQRRYDAAKDDPTAWMSFDEVMAELRALDGE